MSRRVVSLILLPCVLLTQSAAHGHAHGGGRPAGHDSRPHFHAGVIPTAEAPPTHHHHGHAHHGHRHGGHHHHADPPEPRECPPAPPADHDSDAVHLVGCDAVGGSPAADGEHTLSVPPALPAAPPTRSPRACLARRAGKGGRAPPGVGPCPLYVRHLALLI